MIDAHCHLCSEEFSSDVCAVVERAKSAGVAACLVNTESSAEYAACLRMAKSFPGFAIPCLGVHPVQYEKAVTTGRESEMVGRSATLADLAGLEECLKQNPAAVVALGEVGLDFSPRFVPQPGDKDGQRAVLREQIRLASKLDLPLISHSRSAGKPTIDLFREAGATRVLLHAFDGSAKSARPGVEAGFFFSIPPCIARGEQKQRLVKALPLEQILLETDSPVLGPTKEERNEPANCAVSAQWIADLKGVSVQEVTRVTTLNAHRLFPKLQALMNS